MRSCQNSAQQTRFNGKKCMTRIILSIISIILCTAALSASTYAWYLLSITSGTNTVTTADYKLNISLTEHDVNIDSATTQMSGDAHTKQGLVSDTYELSLTPDTSSGFYATGYAKLTFTDASNSENTAVYYVFVGTSRTLTITLSRTSNLTIEAHWGDPANYSVTPIGTDVHTLTF